MKTEFPLLSKSPTLFSIRTQTMLASSVISKPSFTKPLCLRRPFPSSQNRLFRIRFSSSVTASFSDLRQVNPIIPQTIQKNKLLVGRFGKFPLFFFSRNLFSLVWKGKRNPLHRATAEAGSDGGLGLQQRRVRSGLAHLRRGIFSSGRSSQPYDLWRGPRS